MSDKGKGKGKGKSAPPPPPPAKKPAPKKPAAAAAPASTKAAPKKAARPATAAPAPAKKPKVEAKKEEEEEDQEGDDHDDDDEDGEGDDDEEDESSGDDDDDEADEADLLALSTHGDGVRAFASEAGGEAAKAKAAEAAKRGDKRKPDPAASKPTKKAKTAAAAADDDTKDDASEDDEDDANDINVQFDIFDPVPDDFHTVKMLLKNYGDSDEFDVSGLADAISGQVEVGSMVKADSDDSRSPMAFITALNLHKHKGATWAKQLRKMILSKCPEKMKAQLTKVLDDEKRGLGLIVHERLVNIPAELVPPLHDALQRDLKFATTDPDASAEHKDDFRFAHYLLVSRSFQVTESKKKKAVSGTAANAFPKYFEDDFYKTESEFVFSFPARQAETSSEMERIPQSRVVMLLTPAQFARAVANVNALVQPPAETPAAPAAASSSSSSSSSSSGSKAGKKKK